MTFKVGDQVQLKSGGPVMTVAGVVKHLSGMVDVQQTNGHIKCQWFSGKKLETGAFPSESLQEPVDEK